VSVGSLSKAFGLGHVRVGWIATRNEALLSRVDTILADYVGGPLSAPSLSIGAMALKRADAILAKARATIEHNLKLLGGWVSRHNAFQWVRPSGGTVCFIKLPPGVDDVQLSDALRTRYDTLVAPGHFFWKKGFIRVSYGGDPDVLRAGLRAIQAGVDELSGR
jgi:aspartate/methionine/tyrosine aminotransferase